MSDPVLTIGIREGRFRLTLARCAQGHHWPAAELFNLAGKRFPTGFHIIPETCPECRGTWEALEG